MAQSECTYLESGSPLLKVEEAKMETTQDPGRKHGAVLHQATLLGILALITVAVALLALFVPDVNIELPVIPTFNDYPISPHTGV